MQTVHCSLPIKKLSLQSACSLHPKITIGESKKQIIKKQIILSA